MPAMSDLDTVNQLVELQRVLQDCLCEADEILRRAEAERGKLDCVVASNEELKQASAEAGMQLKQVTVLSKAASEALEAVRGYRDEIKKLEHSLTAAVNVFGGSGGVERLTEHQRQISHSLEHLDARCADATSTLKEASALASEALERCRQVEHCAREVATSYHDLQLAADQANAGARCAAAARDHVVSLAEQVSTEIQVFGGRAALDSLRHSLETQARSITRLRQQLISVALLIVVGLVGYVQWLRHLTSGAPNRAVLSAGVGPSVSMISVGHNARPLRRTEPDKVLGRQSGPIWSIAISPDGKRLAVGAGDLHHPRACYELAACRAIRRESMIIPKATR